MTEMTVVLNAVVLDAAREALRERLLDGVAALESGLLRADRDSIGRETRRRWRGLVDAGALLERIGWGPGRPGEMATLEVSARADLLLGALACRLTALQDVAADGRRAGDVDALARASAEIEAVTAGLEAVRAAAGESGDGECAGPR